MVSDNNKQKKIVPQDALTQRGRVTLIAELKLSVWLYKNKRQVINYREGGQLQNWKIVCLKLSVPFLRESGAFWPIPSPPPPLPIIWIYGNNQHLILGWRQNTER